MKINELQQLQFFHDGTNYRWIYHKNVIYHIPNDVKFKCQKCGNCCKTNYVPLTFGDIRRIRMFLQRNKKLRKLKKNFYEEHLEWMDFSYSSSGYYVRRIKYKGEFIGGIWNEEKCLFLSNENTCLIYKIRPNKCKSYPFGLLEDFIREKQLHIGFNFEGKDGQYVCNGFLKGQQTEVELNNLDQIIIKNIIECRESVKKRKDIHGL